MPAIREIEMKDGPKKFRELLARGGLIVAPGVYDGYSARLVEKAGFKISETPKTWDGVWNFFKQMQAGADKYAAKNADKFDFKAVGMKDERDFAAQVDAIENFVTQKFNIIVIAPADSKAMVTPTRAASRPVCFSRTSSMFGDHSHDFQRSPRGLPLATAV